MLRQTVRLVTFDVTNTLLRFRVSPGQQYSEVAAGCGFSLDSEDTAKKFTKHYKAMCSQYPNFGKDFHIHWCEWWRKIVRATFHPHITDPETLEKLADHLIHSYKSKEYWIVNDGTEDILKFLKGRSVSLGVISNFDPRLRDVLTNVGLIKYFDFVLISYEVGFAKPQKEIFLEALTRSKVPNIEPAEALHVGDSLELDYAGARGAGWRAAVVHPGLSVSAPKDHVFSDLKHLKRYLSLSEHILCN